MGKYTKESWYPLKYIYKDASVSTEEVEEWQKAQQEEELREAETVIITKYVKAGQIEGIEEATPKTKRTFERNDIYLIYVEGESPIHIVVSDIKQLLEDTTF